VSGELSGLFVALSNFGAFGILVAFLIWKDLRAEAARNKLEQDYKAEALAAQERRLAYDRERLEADKALASGLAALTSAIQSRGQ
jgi:hypothetical protein